MLPDSCSASAMGIDSSTTLSWPPSSHRRVNHTPARLRLKEERKRIIRALDAKYRTIDDHERGMLRFVLIRNNLRRLQREAREEKLARHRANLSGSRVSNLSPSCLSATRSRSPSPPGDYGYADPLSSYATVGSPSLGEDEHEPPAKRACLFFDDDKENEMDVDDHFHHHSPLQQQQHQQQPPSLNLESKTSSSPCRPVDDAQEILRDLYETCVSEGITSRSTSYSDNFFCTQPQQQQTTFSLSMSASCSVSSSINNNSIINSSSTTNTCSSNSSCESDWPSRHSQYPFNCGHSSLLGNDLQSVVFHSLITSLES